MSQLSQDEAIHGCGPRFLLLGTGPIAYAGTDFGDQRRAVPRQNGTKSINFA